jgi:nucleoside-diphosphate-sugar epimerase
MKVLLTGSRGRLGPAIHRRLTKDAHEVTGFDLEAGDDVLDASAVATAARGQTAIVHVAGAAGDRSRAPAEILKLNLVGMANVLLAAEAQGVERVIYLSSGRALGLLERDADYLPMDDAHRGLPSAPYALSKWLSEEMCEAFTARTGVKTLCLRPVQVFDKDDYAKAIARVDATNENSVWALGVHIDVRDVADAVAAAVSCDCPAHARVLLSAPDIASVRPTLEIVAARAPRVPWRGGVEYQEDPFRSLIDLGNAKRILGWQPRHRWPGRP